MINCSPSKASERISLAFDTLALPSVQNKEMYPYAFDLLVLALPHLPAKWSAHLQQATPASQYMFLHKHQSWLLRHICLVRVCHLFFGLECLPCCNLICSASKVWLYFFWCCFGWAGSSIESSKYRPKRVCSSEFLKTIKHEKSASNSNSGNVAAVRK